MMVGCIVAAMRRVGMSFHHVISDGVVESLLDLRQIEISVCQMFVRDFVSEWINSG